MRITDYLCRLPLICIVFDNFTLFLAKMNKFLVEKNIFSIFAYGFLKVKLKNCK